MTVTFARRYGREHLKKGRKLIQILYGCPEKYLTQEKTDEAHKTK
jgi:hypothetical protein